MQRETNDNSAREIDEAEAAVSQGNRKPIYGITKTLSRDTQKQIEHVNDKMESF
jgi:hypothetical protein